MLGFIVRNTQNLKKKTSTSKTLHCSLVRPTLDYGSIIWSQDLSTYINDLELVQYKFLKRIALSLLYLYLDILTKTFKYQFV